MTDSILCCDRQTSMIENFLSLSLSTRSSSHSGKRMYKGLHSNINGLFVGQMCPGGPMSLVLSTTLVL